MNAQDVRLFRVLRRCAKMRDVGFKHDNAHGKFCNKAAVIVASCELTGCKNWRDFIRLSSGIYKGGGKLTKLGV
jgi:hypothetical protein